METRRDVRRRIGKSLPGGRLVGPTRPDDWTTPDLTSLLSSLCPDNVTICASRMSYHFCSVRPDRAATSML